MSEYRIINIKHNLRIQFVIRGLRYEEYKFEQKITVFWFNFR